MLLGLSRVGQKVFVTVGFDGGVSTFSCAPSLYALLRALPSGSFLRGVGTYVGAIAEGAEILVAIGDIEGVAVLLGFASDALACLELS